VRRKEGGAGLERKKRRSEKRYISARSGEGEAEKSLGKGGRGGKEKKGPHTVAEGKKRETGLKRKRRGGGKAPFCLCRRRGRKAGGEGRGEGPRFYLMEKTDCGEKKRRGNFDLLFAIEGRIGARTEEKKKKKRKTIVIYPSKSLCREREVKERGKKKKKGGGLLLFSPAQGGEKGKNPKGKKRQTEKKRKKKGEGRKAGKKSSYRRETHGGKRKKKSKKTGGKKKEKRKKKG